MSVIKTYSVVCDLPPFVHPCDHQQISSCAWTVGDAMEMSDVREQARRAGWVRIHGKDYCPAGAAQLASFQRPLTKIEEL